MVPNLRCSNPFLADDPGLTPAPKDGPDILMPGAPPDNVPRRAGHQARGAPVGEYMCCRRNLQARGLKQLIIIPPLRLIDRSSVQYRPRRRCGLQIRRARPSHGPAGHPEVGPDHPTFAPDYDPAALKSGYVSPVKSESARDLSRGDAKVSGLRPRG